MCIVVSELVRVNYMMLSIVIEHFISLPSTQLTPYNQEDVEADGQVALQGDLQPSPQTALPSSSSFSLLPIFFRSPPKPSQNI